jgi:hypothetical protein
VRKWKPEALLQKQKHHRSHLGEISETPSIPAAAFVSPHSRITMSFSSQTLESSLGLGVTSSEITFPLYRPGYLLIDHADLRR